MNRRKRKWKLREEDRNPIPKLSGYWKCESGHIVVGTSDSGQALCKRRVFHPSPDKVHTMCVDCGSRHPNVKREDFKRVESIEMFPGKIEPRIVQYHMRHIGEDMRYEHESRAPMCGGPVVFVGSAGWYENCGAHMVFHPGEITADEKEDAEL